MTASCYLWVTGRIKELINRGGEKISPTEIDAVLLGDPAVAEAAAFAVPDPIYGEEIHAAVVPQAEVTAAALQAYCRSRLADFKVPKVIHLVKELPDEGRTLRQADRSLWRRRLLCCRSPGAREGPHRGAGCGETGPDQLCDRSDDGDGERPHRQSQPAEQYSTETVRDKEARVATRPLRHGPDGWPRRRTGGSAR